jgi:hypothetical protein
LLLLVLDTNRSLVQIKSHAQKVLKRLEAGEDVFRRLDENMGIINSLIVQAARQRDAVGGGPVPLATRPSPAEAKRKRVATLKPLLLPKPTNNVSSASCTSSSTDDASEQHQDAISDAPEYGRGAVIAAAALCQLSSLAGSAWDQNAKMQKTC